MKPGPKPNPAGRYRRRLVSLPPDVSDRLDTLALERGMPVSQVVADLIRRARK